MLPTLSETVPSASVTPPSLITWLAPEWFTVSVTVVWDTLFATVVVYETVVESNIPKSTPLNARDLRVASPDSSYQFALTTP